MTTTNESDPASDKKPGVKWTLLVCGAILLAAAGITAVIFSTEPTATREGATRKSAMLVDVVRVERATYTPDIEVMGTVMPSRDVEFRPRVRGEVVELGEAFTPGGTVEEGDMLVRIDSADYEIAVQQRRSELRQAEAGLATEQGRRVVAEQDYAMLSDSTTEVNEDLVLRGPQLETAKAQVESARAALRQAELDLERTEVRAPFSAHVLSRHVHVGSQVSPDTVLARLVGGETYWVETTVPLATLQRIAIPEGVGAEAASVRIRDRAAWPTDAVRTGKVDRLVGALEDRTRMARLLVTVEDPLALGPMAGQPTLMIGAFVEARIEARPIQDVIRLDRDYVHKNDTVWVMKDGLLQIRTVEIDYRDGSFAYITGGVEDGEQVVTSRLSTVVEGAELRVESDETTPAGSTEDGS